MKPQVKKAIGLIVAILVLYVPVIYLAKFDTKKEIIISPTTVTVSPQAENKPAARLSSFTGYDYVTNLVVGNKLHLTPVDVSHSALDVNIGDIWYDSQQDRLMMYNGTSPDGIQMVPNVTYKTITATQINAGDSVQVLPPADSAKYYAIDKILFKYNAGTAFSGTGTDSTFICSTYRGAKNKLAHVQDAMFADTVDKWEMVVPNGGFDANSPMWIDFASQYTTGTGSVDMIVFWIKF